MFMADDKYTFHVEQFSKVLDSIKLMLADNHAETGVYDKPFNPDYARYLSLDSQGFLAFFTVRETVGGKIVGFAIFFLDVEIQQRDTVSARQSVNYVAKQHRGVAYPFMKFCDDKLKECGINSVWRQSTVKRDIGKVYERMGYGPIEKSYLRRF